MKKAPEWLKAAVADSGAQVLTGDRPQAEAAAAVKAAILARPEFIDEMAAVLAASQVGFWVKAHRSSGDLFQAGLFPGIEPVMFTSPGRSMATLDMTLADLKKARSMLLTRTQNAKAAADKAQKDFAAFYRKVRPLLEADPGRTVEQALAELAAKAA
jgi:hypothetical protein